jgi:hypothetical protein
MKGCENDGTFLSEQWFEVECIGLFADELKYQNLW